MSLTPEETKQIADEMVKHIQSTHHNFWIDPETHYQDHLAMREVVGSWTTARGIFTKAFIGLVVLGAIILSAVAVFKVKGG
jgi:tetrahydromethanopterin S-methyltransferase subunit B